MIKRVWKLGNLEHNIYPTQAAVDKLKEILTKNGEVEEIVWGPDLEVIDLLSDQNLTTRQILQKALDANIVIFDVDAKSGEFSYRLLTLIFETAECQDTEVEMLYFPNRCEKYLPDSFKVCGANFGCYSCIDKGGWLYEEFKKSISLPEGDIYYIIIKLKNGSYMLASF